MLNKDSTDGILFPKKNVQKYLIINSIIGPRKSGKTTLIKSVIEYFTKIKKWDNSNIISLSSKEGNLKIFVENVSNIFSSINCIKFSDTIISVIDGFFGLELETFETITLSKNSDLKKIIFILTHLDLFKTWKTLKKAKKRIKDRLIKETNGQCKIFYFNGLRNNNSYFSAEIKNLTRYLNKIQSLSSLVRKTQDFGVISKASSVFRILSCSAIDIFRTGVNTTFSSVPWVLMFVSFLPFITLIIISPGFGDNPTIIPAYTGSL